MSGDKPGVTAWIHITNNTHTNIHQNDAHRRGTERPMPLAESKKPHAL